MSEADKTKNTRSRGKEYPGVDIEECIRFVSNFKDYPKSKPISYDAAAKHLNLSPTTKSFKYSISASRQFGLIERGSGTAMILTDLAYKLIFPTTEDLTPLKLQCFKQPNIYQQLINEYIGRPIPNQTTLENILVTNYGISSTVKKVAAKTFLDSANYSGANVSGILTLEFKDKEHQDMHSMQDSNSPDITDFLPANPPTQSNINNTKNLLANPGYERLVIPIGDLREVVLQFPADMSKKEAKKAKRMIDIEFEDILDEDSDK